MLLQAFPAPITPEFPMTEPTSLPSLLLAASSSNAQSARASSSSSSSSSQKPSSFANSFSQLYSKEPRKEEPRKPTNDVQITSITTPTPAAQTECVLLKPEEYPMYAGELTVVAPFSQQVAGHCPMLAAKGDKLVKPMAPRELWFYANAARVPEYAKWIPSFFGCVCLQRSQYRIISEQAAEIGVDTAADPSSRTQNTFEGRSAISDINEGLPWSTYMHMKQLASKRESDDTGRYFIVLRDHTRAFVRPCIMDIKMGKRQYADSASEYKQRKQILKCNLTTSSLLGIRLCGMQVYNNTTKSNYRMHKYEGRRITHDSIQEALARFFTAGCTVAIRKSIIQAFIDNLRELLGMVERNRFFRMYSSSLLLIYEGDEQEQQQQGAKPTIETKIIDYANVHPTIPSKPNDDGFVDGLQSLMTLLQKIMSRMC